MRKRSLAVLMLGALGLITTSGAAWQWSGPHWRGVPTITVVGRADDPRLSVVRDAVEFWNRAFALLPTRFRFGRITRIDGSVSEQDLENARDTEKPGAFASYPGDLVIVLSDADFVSFTSHIGDRMLVAIKNGSTSPLNLPNVLPNVIAHELGHALGLQHNSDPSTLMCGRPSPCRPAAFLSDSPRMFPLTPADLARLRELYPAHWHAD
jgi:Matrixin